MGDKDEDDQFNREDGYSEVGEEESHKGSQVEDGADLKASEKLFGFVCFYYLHFQSSSDF
jgi:hypothetical protein